jgi:hypothetical protein
MRWFLIYPFFGFVNWAQEFVPSQVLDNEPILFVSSELDRLVTSQVISPDEATVLLEFFNHGGFVSNSYQLQGLLAPESTKLIQVLLANINFTSPSYQSTKRISGQYELRCFSPLFSFHQGQGFSIYNDTNYAGSNFAFQHRINLDYNNWHTGFQVAKDAGEPLWHTNQTKGLDFFTGFLAWRNPNKTYLIQHLVLGSYQFQWGQGLLLWSSRGLGKSIDLLQLAKKPMGMKPYQGRDEQRFLNGISGSCRLFEQELLFLASVKLIDAKPIQDSLQPEFNFSFSNGLHRTPSEILKRKQGLEQIYGIGLRHQSALWQGGALLLNQSVQVRDWISDSLNAKQVSPLHFWSASTYAQGTWKQCYLYGELAGTFKKQEALRQALSLNVALVYFLDQNLEFGLHYRNYGVAYQTLYANPIGNNNLGRNERGLIIQMKWQAFKYLTLRFCAEGVQIPWLIGPQLIPQRNGDVRISLNYQPSKKRTFTQQFAYRASEFEFYQLRLQGQFEASLSDADAFLLSYQFNRDLKCKENSRQVSLNYRHSPLGSSLSFECHYGLFQVPKDAPGLYSQLYLLGFGMQSFELNGIGSYALGAFKYALAKNWDFTFAIRLRNKFSPYLTREIQVLFGIRKKI